MTGLANGMLAAFPGAEEWAAVGLSKREEFAKAAMQALIARTHEPVVSLDEQARMARCVASQAVRYADALLEQLARE